MMKWMMWFGWKNVNEGLMIGGLKLKVYRCIRSVFVIRISVENESGAFRHAPTVSAVTPFWRCSVRALVFWWISPDFLWFKSASLVRRQENTSSEVSSLTTTLESIFSGAPLFWGEWSAELQSTTALPWSRQITQVTPPIISPPFLHSPLLFV